MVTKLSIKRIERCFILFYKYNTFQTFNVASRAQSRLKTQTRQPLRNLNTYI